MPGVADPSTLRDIALFADMPDDKLEALNQHLRRRVFAAGTNVISAETPGDVVYVILAGTVKIKVDQTDGSEVIIAMLGPGEMVGELSVLDSAGRSADVMTQEECVMLWLDRTTFDDLITAEPVVMHNLLRLLSRRIRLSTEQIQALCTLDVYGKVARQLLVFASQYGVRGPEGTVIPMRLTQSDVAGLVGASRERVNQVFVSLRGRGLLKVDTTYRVTVVDPEKLLDIVRQR